MNQPIYADHAATTRLDQEALDAMLPWLTTSYANASQPYGFARPPKKALQAARETIAACINALPEEIYFTSGGTESDNWAIKGCAFSDRTKQQTVTSAIEHHAVLNACRSIERLGYPVAYLAPDAAGTIHPARLAETLNVPTHLVSVMFSNNEIGTIEPIRLLAEEAHHHGAIFHTDAVQAVGHVPIDVNALGVDLLSASAHKFHGPKGIGFLYIRRGTKLEPLHHGGAQEQGLRAGTENIAAIVGMAKALENSVNAIEEVTRHLLLLEETLLAQLRAAGLDFIRNGASTRVPGNVSLSFRGASGETLLHRLDLMGISVSTGSACDSVHTQLSHVLQAIQLEESYARGTIRISFGRENTLEEAGRIAESLVRILGQREIRNVE